MTVLTVLLVLGAGYLAVCALWPYTACRRCHGTGRHRSPTGRSWRKCGRCGGSGQRRRAGRRLLGRAAVAQGRRRARRPTLSPRRGRAAPGSAAPAAPAPAHTGPRQPACGRSSRTGTPGSAPRSPRQHGPGAGPPASSPPGTRPSRTPAAAPAGPPAGTGSGHGTSGKRGPWSPQARRARGIVGRSPAAVTCDATYKSLRRFPVWPVWGFPATPHGLVSASA